MPVASTSTTTPNHTLKKFKNLDDTATSGCHLLDVNASFHDLILENRKDVEFSDLSAGIVSESIVEEVCNCDRDTCGSNASSLLHLSLSIGKGGKAATTCPTTEAASTEFKLKQELLNDVTNYFEEEDEDEQIKRKENLLQELLKIEKQLEMQKKQQHQVTKSPATGAKCSQDEMNNSNNYDHISMINKYLIKKCQYDLNRLYKIKLKQLQQKPIELSKCMLENKQPVSLKLDSSKQTAASCPTTVTKSAKKRLISSSSSSSSSSSTSMARSTVDQQPSLDFKQFIPKLISSDTFREDNQAQQSVAHLSTNLSSLSSSISNSLSEFKKLANTEAAVVCEATNQGSSKKPESTTALSSSIMNSALNTPVSLSDIQTTLFFKSSPQQQQSSSSSTTTTSTSSKKTIVSSGTLGQSPATATPPPPVPHFPPTSAQQPQPSVQQITSILNSKFNAIDQETAMKSLVVQKAVAAACAEKNNTSPGAHYVCPHGHDHRHQHHYHHHHHHANAIALKQGHSTTAGAKNNVSQKHFFALQEIPLQANSHLKP